MITLRLSAGCAAPGANSGTVRARRPLGPLVGHGRGPGDQRRPDLPPGPHRRARALPGSFEPPAGLDPAQRVISGLAQSPYRHQVTLRVQGTLEQIRTRLPASVATVTELPATGEAGPAADRWLSVEMRA